MLVVRRDDDCPDQSDTHLTCACGCEVMVRLVEARKGWAKLGFEAPRTTDIRRADAGATGEGRDRE